MVREIILDQAFLNKQESDIINYSLFMGKPKNKDRINTSLEPLLDKVFQDPNYSFEKESDNILNDSNYKPKLERFRERLLLSFNTKDQKNADFRFELRYFDNPKNINSFGNSPRPVKILVSSDLDNWEEVASYTHTGKDDFCTFSFELFNFKNSGNIYIMLDNRDNFGVDKFYYQSVVSILLFKRDYDYPKEYVNELNNSFESDLGLDTSNIGPAIVQIDLTNNCNYNCVGCWCHSDLLKDKMLSPEEKKQFISFDIIEKIIENLKEFKTQKIMLAGSGEPMMHPQIKDIIKLIKNAGFKLEIITNFSFVNKDMADLLIEYKVELLTISMWAGDEKTYLKTHPNQTKKTFNKIKKNLFYLNKNKNIYPETKLFNVISSKNYMHLYEMIDFGISTASDFIEFQLIDIVKGYTDSLALKPRHIDKVLKQLEKAKLRKEYMPVKPKWEKEELKEYGRFFCLEHLSSDFKFNITPEKVFEAWCQEKIDDVTHVHNITCIDDNYINKGLLFYFDKEKCIRCNYKESCNIRKDDYFVKAPYLSLLNYEPFVSQLMSVKNKLSKVKSPSCFIKNHFIDSIPCYAGHIYSRILVNGNVIPCCKAEFMPKGNVFYKSFKDIWFSKIYQEFRTRAFSLKKNNPYFAQIDCYSSCDNYGMNLQFDQMRNKE